MKPTDITKVLDLALLAREQKRTFNPLFAGDAGIGKSEICQAWVKKQQEKDPSFGFLDLRLAYLEGPDFIGLPEKVVEADGKRRTTTILPDFWPREGTRGLMLIEEPNRANSSVMNCLMQVLTDRKVHNYKVPDGWVIAGAINPDNANYDVNSMDIALRNRFVIYNVEYDQKTFLGFMKSNNWHPSLVSFVESGIFQYKRPDEISENGMYISPRTFSQLNTAEQSGLAEDSDLHYQTSMAILGNAVGREYYKFRFENTPVLAQDLIKNKKAALKKLKGYSGDNYNGDLIAATINSLVEAYPEKIDDAILIEVAKIIPKDQSVALLKTCVTKTGNLYGDGKFKKLSDFIAVDPELKEALTGTLRKGKTEKAKKNTDVSEDI